MFDSATFEGLLSVWAVLEHLAGDLRSRTLRLSYHQLNNLVKQRNNVSNFQMMVEETSDGLLFLHQLQICEASFSYGIEAALLSGVPSPVVLRAHQLLDPLAA